MEVTRAEQCSYIKIAVLRGKNAMQYHSELVEALGSNALPYRTLARTATAGSNVVQSGHAIFDDFFQHLWPYIGNNTANVFFQMVKRLWLIRIDQ
ncbi:hypothetical protein TNCV_2105401 [Trichonephila clavipes]|nr:hypothetical protein TNCV_2105401 [Trichonephila clavipes]